MKLVYRGEILRGNAVGVFASFVQRSEDRHGEIVASIMLTYRSVIVLPVHRVLLLRARFYSPFVGGTVQSLLSPA